MGRYSRYTSSFIQKKKEQTINGGSIIERDWTTIGERHVIEPGKQRVYSDSGFLFTESTLPGIKKRNRTEEWSDAYTINDLAPTVNDEVNIIKLPDSQNLNDYAYYGSAEELVRASIENIIKWFPGKAWSNNEYIRRNLVDSTKVLYEITGDTLHNYVLDYIDEKNVNKNGNNPKIYKLENPFLFDFYKSGLSFSKNDNSLRNIPYSWNRYYINGCKILSYIPWIKGYNECDEDYSVLYEAYFTYESFPSVSKLNEFYQDYNVGLDCVTFNDNLTQEDDCITFDSRDVTFREGHIYGLKLGKEILWCTDVPNFSLTPIPSVITEYFNNLDGFERLLLSKKTNPIYTPILKTPELKGGSSHEYYLVNREYQFPSNGYCILCNSILYEKYIDALQNLAINMDKLYSDNIWENMTHESIKNFDWTYQKDFEEGDDIDNIFGGTRLKNILRIYGRFFDDIKRYIDNIKLKNCITFDGNNNLPVAELSDKAQLIGWEVYSTKLNNNSNLSISEEYIELEVDKKQNRWDFIEYTSDSPYFRKDNQVKWYEGISPDRITENDIDNHFMRMLNINGPHIFRRKGTKQSIEMVMALFGLGNEDFTLSERYYSIQPKKSNDIIWVYKKVEDEVTPELYKDVSGDTYMTFNEYIYSLKNGVNENSEPYIHLNGNYYDLKKYTFKELCVLINSYKIFDKLYENDIFSGIPLKEITINKENYIVPYFSQNVIYDGNVQFQTKGGWGKYMTFDYEIEVYEKHNYSETLPHVQTIQNCSDLLLVNLKDITDETLYYVMDTTDIIKMTETDTTAMSHYFKLIDKYNPQLFSSWRNVPLLAITDIYDYENYCNELDELNNPVRPLYYGISYQDYQNMEYNESIIMDNLGNNPHTGKGGYDIGNEYLLYLNRPFYFAETHYGFKDEDIQLMAENVQFNVNEHIKEKIIINNNINNDYFLPSKVLTITLHNTSSTFYKYFKNVIFKYLTQVIPSTTILLIEMH